jgi:hypothetical protein
VHHVVSGIRDGFSLGFEGPQVSYTVGNMSSTKEHPEVVKEYLDTEVTLGRVLGPFENPPFPDFRCSPIGVVPKKDKNKFRLIMNLSAPKGLSVNDFIDKERYSLSYVTVDNAIDQVVSVGRGCLLSKVDVEAAFRIVPVNPVHWNLLGFSFQGRFYVDTVLSMGGRSSPAIFDAIAKAAEWICVNNHHIEFLIHLLDDFLSVERPGSEGTALKKILKAFSSLGIPVNEKKVEGPTTCLEFLGISLDTGEMEARLSPEKIAKLKELVLSFRGRKKCTQKELLSLVGSLSFACRVIRPGRSFLSRLIALAYSVRELHHMIRIPKGIKRDMNLWLHFLRDWNGRKFFLQKEHGWTDHEFSTDASGVIGFGGVFLDEWFHGTWNEAQRSWSIEVQELYPIVVAAQLWGEKWSSQRIVVKCDNAAVVSAVNKGYTKVPILSDLLRVLVYLSMTHNFMFRAVHLPGLDNKLADHLSRLKVDQFHEAAPWAREEPAQLPPSPLLLCEKVFNS